MASPNLIQKVLAWARSAEEASGVPKSAKYFYDASKALNDGKAAVLTDAETERLMRAVQSGHNTIVQRLGVPARDEQHLLEMRDNWLQLPPESKGFHVDLTPGGPAALMRQNNLRTRNLDPRPLSVAVRKPVNATDAQANADGFLKKTRRSGNDTIIYTPTQGELTPGSDVGNVYNSVTAEDFMLSHEKAAPGIWQPSAAILKPENVRDLFDAEFKNPKATGLGYAQGGPVSKRPEMEHKVGAVNQSARDNPLTGSALQALARGWVAGTAGLPGDIEELGRMGVNALGGKAGKYTALPTSDYFKEVLPGKQVGDEALASLGSLFGGVGVGTTAKGARAATKAVPGALTQVAKNATVPRTLSAQAGVIKAPGGNWLSGSVEDALRGLRQHQNPQDALDLAQTELARPNADPATLAAVNERLPGWQREAALNQFIDKQLTRYIKNDMATERDPIRALAERGVLHYEPRPPTGPVQRAMEHRADAKQPTGGYADSDLARHYETMTDSSIGGHAAGDWMKNASPGVIEKNPWLSKLSPEVPVYEKTSPGLSDNLGFPHLIDELRNATNPQSGLPANLLLKPESLGRVSMPQAVEHVAKINAWREAQKIEANAAKANNAATVAFKEYAENNPKGLRWVELKAPAAKSVEDLTPDQASWYQEYVQGGVSPEKALAEASKRGDKSLADALKYEGDTMGHCVGGYCDEVAAGKSRIYSLRDAKGQPHTTIEVKPGVAKSWAERLASKEYDGVFDQAQKELGFVGDEHLSDSSKMKALSAKAQEIASSMYGEPEVTNRIIQIKGKGNKKPNDEYLPFVQDFVKSGKWSDVGDLNNTGLQRADWQAGTLAEMTKHGIQAPAYGTPDEINAAINALNKAKGFGNKGFAKGGPVKADCGCSPKGYAEGGAVPPTSGYGGGDEFTQADPADAAANAADAQRRAAHTSANRMSREDFLRKYGTTFVADDRGGNAASEVAGQDVGAYYDQYLADGATGDLVARHWDSEIPEGTRAMPTFGWKYRDANPYFDAWDNVDPHPESQDLGGVGEFWRQIGRPVATAAATYFGVSALGGALGGAGAASTAAPAAALDGGLAAAASSSEGLAALQAANAGSGAMGSGLGSMAAGTAAPTLTAAQNAAIAASIPQQASGLAGLMGMNAGYGASALNSGALNTAVGLARGQNIGEALRGGVTAAALSPIGGYVSNAVGGGALGTIAGNTATGGAQGLVSGRGLTDGLQQGLVSGLVSAAGDYAGGVARGATGSRFAGTAANALTRSTLRGQRPGSTLDSLATQYAAGEISDLSGLDPAMVSIVVNLARNKRVSPVGALSAVGSRQTRNRAVGS